MIVLVLAQSTTNLDQPFLTSRLRLTAHTQW